jgi:hypothetical protein
VRELYGDTRAANFGPRALKAVRQHMLTLPCGQCQGTGRLKKARRPKNRRSGNAGLVCRRCAGVGRQSWARSLINSSVGCIKRMVKWGVAEELIPAEVYHALLAVEGFRKGRSEARETRPVRPVADDQV